MIMNIIHNDSNHHLKKKSHHSKKCIRRKRVKFSYEASIVPSCPTQTPGPVDCKINDSEQPGLPTSSSTWFNREEVKTFLNVAKQEAKYIVENGFSSAEELTFGLSFKETLQRNSLSTKTSLFNETVSMNNDNITHPKSAKEKEKKKDDSMIETLGLEMMICKKRCVYRKIVRKAVLEMQARVKKRRKSKKSGDLDSEKIIAMASLKFSHWSKEIAYRTAKTGSCR